MSVPGDATHDVITFFRIFHWANYMEKKANGMK